eukprot:TRINITY_DN5766_c0_g2_i7.p1 TRINITY_DN5766_c0_g2~~TRINITY_DN5766_c0_g2_i7.p1  ORF type:complete len:161 (+),score=4.17 TRINITY_DN5766_c0_g2_i7:221-703(+)
MLSFYQDTPINVYVLLFLPYIISRHTSSFLPLPFSPTRYVCCSTIPYNRPKIDFVVIMVDVERQSSFNDLKTFLGTRLHPDYLMGKTAVILSLRPSSSHAFTSIDVKKVTDHYQVPLYPYLPEDQASLKNLVEKLLNIINVSIQAKNDVTHLLLRTIELF